MEPVRYPVLQIRPYGLLVYDRIEWPTMRTKHQSAIAFTEQSGKAQYHGLLSPGARKRLKRAIQLIVATAEWKTAINFTTGKEFKFKLNFITLTLPSPQGLITDKQLKKDVLDVWLKSAKRKFSLRSYIWRAERQKNGNLHFHIVTDTYIRYDELRDSWNDRLNRLGFIDQFEAKHNHRHPNSTDVHAIKSVKNLAGYFSKYMAKGERVAEDLYQIPFHRKKWHEKILVSGKLKFKRVLTREESRIDGRLWDCSINLKTKENCEQILEGDQLELFSKAVADESVKRKETDFALILFLSPGQRKQYLTPASAAAYRKWLQMIRNPPDS